ncbi:MAG TPA: hypothetical protein VFZ79_06090 [Acidimicrobiales bacterium]
MAVAVVVATVVIVVAVVVVVLRQGSVGRLSEERGRRDRGRDVVDRPGGPGAEAMRPGPPGEPTSQPPASPPAAGPGEPDR